MIEGSVVEDLAGRKGRTVNPEATGSIPVSTAVSSKDKYLIKNCQHHGENSTWKLVGKGNGKTGYKCIKCSTVEQVRYKRNLKLKCLEYKGGKCEKCGYNKCVSALDFHHLDPTEKDFNFSKKKAKWETLRAELDKCILVCANCHREIHDNGTD